MSLAYDEYLAEHIGNVSKGLQWMLDNLWLSQEEKSAVEDAMAHEHDASKYDTEEYDAYDKYFYGGNRSYKVIQDFNYAWLHHIHKNPHHWQYWVLFEDDPQGIAPFNGLRIHLDYIFEMIADWWSFSWKEENLFEIFDWYAEHRGKQIINPDSRMILERILKKIWNVLLMQESAAGKDISEIEDQYKRFWVEQDNSTQNYIDLFWESGKPLVPTISHSITEPLLKGYSFCKNSSAEPSEKVPDSVTMHYDPMPDTLIMPAMQHDDGKNGDIFGSKYTKRFEDKLLKHSSAQVIGKVVDTRETENGLEVTVEHSDIEDSDEGLYGIPEIKKYPMPDKKHVKSAIRFFNYVDPKYEKELAEAILEKAEEFGLDLESDISVGDENRFQKYLKKEAIDGN